MDGNKKSHHFEVNLADLPETLARRRIVNVFKLSGFI